MKLKDISTINPGLVTTRKKASIKYEVKETYKLLTLNAVDDFGYIDKNELTDFESKEQLPGQYFTQKDDILVRLNEPYTAIYIDEKDQGILIPSYFVKVKINDRSFSSGYIAWYLNSNKVKRDFLRSQSGTLIPSINQRVIKELDIPIKTMNEQEDILELYRLYIREINLLKNLIKEKEKQFDGITEKLLKK